MRKGEKRKLELLEIAYRMFISRGYENTSVDDIIAEAGIAKGTYYYYFESKEQTLEEVIGMMIDKEIEAAGAILDSDMPVPQKIIGIIASINPSQEEKTIEGALMQPENIVMHQKIKRRLVEKVVPLLARAVEEGVEVGGGHDLRHPLLAHHGIELVTSVVVPRLVVLLVDIELVYRAAVGEDVSCGILLLAHLRKQFGRVVVLHELLNGNVPLLIGGGVLSAHGHGT